MRQLSKVSHPGPASTALPLNAWREVQQARDPGRRSTRPYVRPCRESHLLQSGAKQKRARHLRRTLRSWCCVVVCVIALPATIAAATAKTQDLESIRQAVVSFAAVQTPATRGERTIDVTNLDRRLRLQTCEQPLEPFFPPGSRNGRHRTVGVSCSAPKPWTIYVSVRIRYQGEVLVAARSLPRGTIIQDTDLVLEKRDLEDGPFGYLTNLRGALGKRTTQPLRSGTPVTETALETIPTIVRGQKVSLVATSPYLVVRMTGTALQDGAPGDRIQVENSRSKHVVEGVVGVDGMVKIGL